VRFCLVPLNLDVSNFDCRRHRRQHWHISRRDRDELLSNGAAEEIGPRVLRLMRTFALHGVSARFGSYLAGALHRGELWAIALRRDMGGVRCQKSF